MTDDRKLHIKVREIIEDYTRGSGAIISDTMIALVIVAIKEHEYGKK